MSTRRREGSGLPRASAMRKLMLSGLWASDMNDRRPSRRAYLATCTAAATATLAGCFGDDDSNRNDLVGEFDLAGDGTAPFRDWVLPVDGIEMDADVELLCQFDDYETGDQNVPGIEDGRLGTAGMFNVDPEIINAELVVPPSPAFPSRFGNIVFGDFEPVTADIIDFLERPDQGQEITDEYQGYTIIGDVFAVGDDTVLLTDRYESHIDAVAGETDRLTETDEDAALLFDLLPDATRIAVSRHHDIADLVINGESRLEANEDKEVTRSVRTFIFEDEEAASAERAAEIIEDGRGYEEIFETEVHDRIVMVEYNPA